MEPGLGETSSRDQAPTHVCRDVQRRERFKRRVGGTAGWDDIPRHDPTVRDVPGKLSWPAVHHLDGHFAPGRSAPNRHVAKPTKD